MKNNESYALTFISKLFSFFLFKNLDKKINKN